MNSGGTQNHPDLDHLSSDALGFMPWMPAARRLRRAEASVALAPPPCRICTPGGSETVQAVFPPKAPPEAAKKSE